MGKLGVCIHLAGCIVAGFTWRNLCTWWAAPGPAISGGKDLVVYDWLKHCRAERQKRGQQIEENGLIVVDELPGRLGDQLTELAAYLSLALEGGKRGLRLPSEQLAPQTFNFSDVIEVKKGPGPAYRQPCKLRSVEAEERRYYCSGSSLNFCAFSAKLKQQLLRDSLLPYVNPSVYEACTPPGDDTIVLHIGNDEGRGTDRQPLGQQPPCSFFHKILNEGRDGKPFPVVQLVHAAAGEDANLSCIDEIRAKHNSSKTIRTEFGSDRATTCLLLTAQNLAASTTSKLALLLKRLNSRLVRYFWTSNLPEESSAAQMYDLQFPAICEAYPRAVGYRRRSNASQIAENELEALKCPEVLEAEKRAKAAAATATSTGNKLTVAGWLKHCPEAVDDKEKLILVAPWFGRLGNRLAEMSAYLSLAQAANFRGIKLPKGQPGPEVFNFPEVIEVKPGSTSPSPCKLRNIHDDESHYECKWTFVNFCESSAQYKKDVFRDYFLPWVKPQVYQACKPPGDDTVVLHIRNGDVARLYPDRKNEAPFHQQPPCLYFHKVIDEGRDGKPFSKVQMVYSPAIKRAVSLCIDDIKAKHNATKVILPSTGTLTGDACLMLTAQNFAATTSTLSTIMKRLNQNLVRYFWVSRMPEESGSAQQYDMQFPGVCEAYPRAVGYRMKKLPEVVSEHEYFTQYPEAYLEELKCPAALAAEAGPAGGR